MEQQFFQANINRPKQRPNGDTSVQTTITQSTIT